MPTTSSPQTPKGPGAVTEFEKTTLVAKLAAARRRKSMATGEKVEGRKSHAEARPDVAALAKARAGA
jgi:hypothetical protein